jgi:hypothetical protein
MILVVAGTPESECIEGVGKIQELPTRLGGVHRLAAHALRQQAVRQGPPDGWLPDGEPAPRRAGYSFTKLLRSMCGRIVTPPQPPIQDAPSAPKITG